jgi:hypothetical protein
VLLMPINATANIEDMHVDVCMEMIVCM